MMSQLNALMSLSGFGLLWMRLSGWTRVILWLVSGVDGGKEAVITLRGNMDFDCPLIRH